MLTYKLATSEQYDVFFQLMLKEAAGYLERTMELIHMTLAETQQLFRTVGQVYGIYQEDVLAGFYWIEERDMILHLHGLVLATAFQGKGLATEVLTMLASTYRGKMDAIELGVHVSNVGAQRLYERLGCQVVEYRDDVGFYIMRCSLAV